MARIITASFLYRRLKDLWLEERKETQQKVCEVPVIFSNPNALKMGENLRVLLEQQPLASNQIIL